MRRRAVRTQWSTEEIPDKTGGCPGLTSRQNRSTVGYRASGDACSKRARFSFFFVFATSPWHIMREKEKKERNDKNGKDY